MDSSSDESEYSSRYPAKRKGTYHMRSNHKCLIDSSISEKENENPIAGTSPDHDFQSATGNYRNIPVTHSRYREPLSSEQSMPSTSKGFYVPLEPFTGIPRKMKEKLSDRKPALEAELNATDSVKNTPSSYSRPEEPFRSGKVMYSTPRYFSVANNVNNPDRIHVKMNEWSDSDAVLEDDLNSSKRLNGCFPIHNSSYRGSGQSSPSMFRNSYRDLRSIQADFFKGVGTTSHADYISLIQRYYGKRNSSKKSRHSNLSESRQEWELPKKASSSFSSSSDESFASGTEEYSRPRDFSEEKNYSFIDSLGKLRTKRSRLFGDSELDQDLAEIFQSLDVMSSNTLEPFSSPDDHSKPNRVTGPSADAHGPIATSKKSRGKASESKNSKRFSDPTDYESNQLLRNENLPLGQAARLPSEPHTSCQGEYDEAHNKHFVSISSEIARNPSHLDPKFQSENIFESFLPNDSNRFDKELKLYWHEGVSINNPIDTSGVTGSVDTSQLTDSLECMVGNPLDEALEELLSTVQDGKVSNKRHNSPEGRSDDTEINHPDIKRRKQNEPEEVDAESQRRRALKRRIELERSDMSLICSETGETQNTKIPKYESGQEL